MVGWQHRCLNLPKQASARFPLPSLVVTLPRQIHDRNGHRKDGLVVHPRARRRRRRSRRPPRRSSSTARCSLTLPRPPVVARAPPIPEQRRTASGAPLARSLFKSRSLSARPFTSAPSSMIRFGGMSARIGCSGRLARVLLAGAGRVGSMATSLRDRLAAGFERGAPGSEPQGS